MRRVCLPIAVDEGTEIVCVRLLVRWIVDSSAELSKDPTEVNRSYAEDLGHGILPAAVDEDSAMVCVRTLVRWIVESGAELVSDPTNVC